MPVNPPQVSPLVLLVFLALLGSIVGAWIWAILRLAFRQPVLPPLTPRVVPWGGKSVLAVVLVWVALQWAVQVGYVTATHGRAPKPKDGGTVLAPVEMMTASALQNTATLIVIPLVLAALAGAGAGDFGVRSAGLGREVARGLVAYPLLAPFVFGAMAASIAIWKPIKHPLQDAIADQRSPGMAALLILAGVVLAPVGEELLFRGVLLGWLTRLALGVRRPPRAKLDVEGPPPPAEGGEVLAPAESRPDLILDESDAELSSWPAIDARPNPYAAPRALVAAPEWPEFAGQNSAPKPEYRLAPLFLANVVVSLIFAALHAPVWPTPIPIFILSLGLGVLYQRTGSILAPIALHMTLNGISTAIMFLSLGAGAAPEAPDKPKPTVPVPPPAATWEDWPVREEILSLVRNRP